MPQRGPSRRCGRYTTEVREQLRQISPATIDRILKPYKAQLQPDGSSTTHATWNQYRQSIPIMTRIPAINRQPGFVAIDTVAHCRLTAKGGYVFALTVAVLFTGWTVNRSVKNKASKWIVLALQEIRTEFPYPIHQAHTDNGSEFLNRAVTTWISEHNISMTRFRPQSLERLSVL